MNIKVCGMREAANIAAIAALKPDYLGFIFYAPSKRFVGEDFDIQRIANLPKTIQKVGVFVNSPLEYVIEKVRKYDLNLVQLHGKESPEFCQSLLEQKIESIKAFSVGQTFDFQQLEAYQNVCKFFLFDTETVNHGGSGKKFDWQLLANYNNPKPFLLSGGIGIEDLDEVLQLNMNMEGIDVNSRFELEPALKNVDLVRQCIEKMKNNG